MVRLFQAFVMGFVFVIFVVYFVWGLVKLLSFYIKLKTKIEAKYLLKFKIYRWYKDVMALYVKFFLRWVGTFTIIFHTLMFFYINKAATFWCIRLEILEYTFSFGYTNKINNLVATVLGLSNTGAVPGILNIMIVLFILSLFGLFYWKKLTFLINCFYLNVILRVAPVLNSAPLDGGTILDYFFIKILKDMTIEEKEAFYNAYCALNFTDGVPAWFTWPFIYPFIHHLNTIASIKSEFEYIIWVMDYIPTLPAPVELLFWSLGTVMAVSCAYFIGQAHPVVRNMHGQINIADILAALMKVWGTYFLADKTEDFFRDRELSKLIVRDRKDKLYFIVDSYFVKGPHNAALENKPMILKPKELPHLEENINNIPYPLPSGEHILNVKTYIGCNILLKVHVDSDGNTTPIDIAALGW